MADCIGDTLRLTVEARDSDARILGAYGYIDAEE